MTLARTLPSRQSEGYSCFQEFYEGIRLGLVEKFSFWREWGREWSLGKDENGSICNCQQKVAMTLSC